MLITREGMKMPRRRKEKEGKKGRLDRNQYGLDLRLKNQGLVGVDTKVPIRDASALSLLYTPGVAAPCLEIAKTPIRSYDLTCRGNTVAVISDGSAVYGIGNAGPEAALAMLEVRSVFFKTFAGVDAIPIALNTQNGDEIVEICLRLASSFGGIVLEDIAAPKCFTVENNLKAATRIPVFHNDQHGSAIIVHAALINALKVVGKTLDKVRIVISGAGAAGIATAKLLLLAGAQQMVLCDRYGSVYRYRTQPLNWAKSEISLSTNLDRRAGSLKDMMEGADVFIGFSAPGIVSKEMVKSMSRGAIVFALANPIPEIMPDVALSAGAAVVGSGRSDFPNEINSADIGPGIFRGLLDVRAWRITPATYLAVAETIAGTVPERKLNPNYLLPRMFDFQVAAKIARVTAQVAIERGDARVEVSPDEVEAKTHRIIYENEYTVLPPPPPRKKKMSMNEEAIDLHQRYQGKLQIKVKVPIRDEYILNKLYLPPLAAEASIVLAKEPGKVYDLTCKANLVAIVSDGSAVLGLGNIGPRAAIPVMEGKAILFKTFAGVEAFPVCVCTQDVNEIVELVKAISPTFGGVNLEDISAPRCFEIEERLKAETDIPVFHDDQHGTAVVVLAALKNALKIVNKELPKVRMVIAGAGAAGIAVTKLLLIAGVRDITLCDVLGAVYEGRTEGMNRTMEEIAKVTNRDKRKGNLAAVIKGADIFLGLSVGGIVKREMVRSMAKDPVILAMANPIPEIMPDEALEAGAAVVATGRSDFPNQVNNSMVFPGVFRGALDVRARSINVQMKIAASDAIAGFVSEKELRPDYIIPHALNFKVPPQVAAAVASAAMETGEARIQVSPEDVAAQTLEYLYEGHMRYLKEGSEAKLD
jgi:malate dehydrogenase (oxaloacetate-decarboxylating)